MKNCYTVGSMFVFHINGQVTGVTNHEYNPIYVHRYGRLEPITDHIPKRDTLYSQIVKIHNILFDPKMKTVTSYDNKYYGFDGSKLNEVIRL